MVNNLSFSNLLFCLLEYKLEKGKISRVLNNILFMIIDFKKTNKYDEYDSLLIVCIMKYENY